MKHIFKRLIILILELEARLILKKHKPEIIAITGSVGKTSAKEAIYAVLSTKFNVRKSEKSYNSELGVPLTLIGESNPWYSAAGWMKVIFKGLGLIFKSDPTYPKKIIIEFGADRRGDIKKLVRYLKPAVGVVTAVGEIPVHVEFFSGSEEVAREKARLVETLPTVGWAILNIDDDVVSDMAKKTRAKVLTFGFGEDANLKASEYKIIYKEGANVPEGLTFKMDYEGSSVPVRIFNTFGKHNVYSALSGAACGVINGMNLVEIAEALGKYQSPPGRLKLIEGEKGVWILDDTYNAAPQAMHAAIDLLKDLPAQVVAVEGVSKTGRKIAVLGDMLEIGKFTVQAHQAIGDRLKEIADLVITVGPRAKFIAQELLDHGFGAKKVISVSDSIEAGQELEKIIEPGDLILVKGSQAMRMERVVEEIMARPEKKSELLVRQDPEWLNKE